MGEYLPGRRNSERGLVDGRLFLALTDEAFPDNAIPRTRSERKKTLDFRAR